MQKACAHCGVAFAAQGPRKYCTIRCRWREKARLDTKRNLVTCTVCGTLFGQRGKKNLRCSAECRRVHVTKHAPRQCRICGVTFKPSGHGYFCSRTCAGKARTLHAPRACLVCEKVFKPDGPRKFCSHACYATSRRTFKDASGNPRNYTSREAKKIKEAFAQICAACGTTQGRLHLDHCHTTGQPRAILCGQCNRALGLLSESPERIKGLLAYAEFCVQFREQNRG